MLALHRSVNLLASLPLSGSIPDEIVWVFAFSLKLILAAAFFGARMTATPFRWRRLVGASFGVVMGIVSMPFALGVSVLVVNLCSPLLRLPMGGSDTAFAIICMVIFLMTSSVAYVASMLGRPTRVAPAMMMETFNQNLREIEEIISGKLCGLGGEVGACLDLNAAQTAGILSREQAGRLEYIFRMQHQLQQARSVLHSDVELSARKSCELLDEIKSQLATNREPRSATKESCQQSLENGNPYAPPAS